MIAVIIVMLMLSWLLAAMDSQPRGRVGINPHRPGRKPEEDMRQ